jgi:hypothetical protein
MANEEKHGEAVVCVFGGWRVNSTTWNCPGITLQMRQFESHPLGGYQEL